MLQGVWSVGGDGYCCLAWFLVPACRGSYHREWLSGAVFSFAVMSPKSEQFLNKYLQGIGLDTSDKVANHWVLLVNGQ